MGFILIKEICKFFSKLFIGKNKVLEQKKNSSKYFISLRDVTSHNGYWYSSHKLAAPLRWSRNSKDDLQRFKRPHHPPLVWEEGLAAAVKNNCPRIYPIYDESGEKHCQINECCNSEIPRRKKLSFCLWENKLILIKIT
jgi:hypothetical protein